MIFLRFLSTFLNIANLAKSNFWDITTSFQVPQRKKQMIHTHVSSHHYHQGVRSTGLMKEVSVGRWLNLVAG